MPQKSNEQQNQAKRLGILGETIVQAFLLEHADFCYPTCDSHPADLIVELGSALYKVQVKSRNPSKEGKFTFPIEAYRKISKTHANYHCELLAFVFLPSKRIYFKANTASQQYYIYSKKHIKKDMEIISFQEALNQLSSIPVLNSLLD